MLYFFFFTFNWTQVNRERTAVISVWAEGLQVISQYAGWREREGEKKKDEKKKAAREGDI